MSCGSSFAIGTKDRASVDKYRTYCWKKDGDEEEAFLSDGTIVLKSLEDEDRVDKFHIHRYCIATGTCRIEYSALEQENEPCLIFLHTNGMVDAFPFVLDYLYSEGSTLFSIYSLPEPRKDIIAILALARYFGLERLVGRLQTYVQKVCFGVQGTKIGKDKQVGSKIALFWLSEALKYGEDNAMDAILAFNARLYANIDKDFKNLIVQDLSKEQVIKVLKLSVEFLTQKSTFMQRRVQMEIDGSMSEEDSLNHKLDRVLWINGTETSKNYFNDWTIVLNSLETEGKISEFQIHRVCVATGKYRSEYFLTLWMMQGNLKEHETCTSEISMCDDMMDSFPFFLENLYGESVEKCFTLNNKYRYGAVTVLGLARYFFAEQLVKDVESYIEKTCAKRIYDEELCEQVGFWVSAAKIYGEDKILNCANEFFMRRNRTLDSVIIQNLIEIDTETCKGIEIPVTYLDIIHEKKIIDKSDRVKDKRRNCCPTSCENCFTSCENCCMSCGKYCGLCALLSIGFICSPCCYFIFKDCGDDD